MGITDPSEEYFKDGLWGYVSTVWKKLVATAGGALHIQIAGQAVDVEVKQQTAADLTPGMMGWDGSAWQKLPLLWGYSGAYSESESLLTHAAGDVTLTFTAVTPGEVWVIENICGYDVDTAPAYVRFYVAIGSDAVILLENQNPIAGTYDIWSGRATLPAGSILRCKFYTTAEDDSCYATACGYKMKIAE